MAMSSIKQTNNSSTQTTNSDHRSNTASSFNSCSTHGGVRVCNNTTTVLVTQTSHGNNGGASSTSSSYLKCGYLRKQKTMKKKFFVLKPETSDNLARLEYYDDEKKWRKHHQPKRSIVLKTCFNINRHQRNDIKQKHVIDLYTKDDCFSIVFDNEDELDEWLRPMLFLQHGEELLDGEPPKPSFEHVWPVEVMERGLGSQSKIRGSYRLCLTDQKLSLVPNGNSKLNILEFSLMGIRRCGASNNFLYIEVGRSSVTGEGDIYMATTDPVIACNMRDIILQAMSNSKKDEFGPKQRIRSNSATESSKTVQMGSTRRPPFKLSELTGNLYSVDRSLLPPFAAATPSAAVVQWCALQRAAAQRRHSVSAVVGTNNGPFIGAGGQMQNTSSQMTVHSNHQRTHSLPVSPADSNSHILNENNNYAPMTSSIGLLGSSSTSSSCTTVAQPSTINTSTTTTTSQTAIDQVDCYIPRRGSVGNRNSNNSSSNLKRHNRTGSGLSVTLSGLTVSGGTFRDNISTCLTGRERCASLPTRERTTSEGQSTTTSRTTASIVHHMRPRSMYTHDGPASPPSNCSTDSAGSSLSIDETDWATDGGQSSDCLASLSRYGHSLTPDEHVIFEENDDWDRPSSSLPKNSPNVSSGIHSESPSGTSCGSSPLDVNAGYVPMCPTDAGYVPMCPGDTGYVPMMCNTNLSGYVPMGPGDSFSNMRVSPAASSCSVTSGTPSTDLRFSEYHLDKVTSYIPLDTSELDNGRPIRTYSVGSKPQRVDTTQGQHESSHRVRAFSVGSHAKGGMRRNLKASSAPAPLVAGSPMGDLMELDFTQRKPTMLTSSKLNSLKDTAPYVDMSGQLSGASPNKPNYSNPYVDMSGKSASPKSHDDYGAWRDRNNDLVAMRSIPTNDGYMDMSYNKRKPTLSQSSNNSDDYLNMSGNKSTSSSSRESKRKDRRDKNRSKPIEIQQNMSSSPKGGPPSYLPLQQTNSPGTSSSPFSTLQRNRHRNKNPETPTPTPTASNTVFTMSLSNSDALRKCPVDATSGTIRIYGNEDYAPMKGSYGSTSSTRTSSTSNDEDYTEIGFDTSATTTTTKLRDTSDYVNYNPTAITAATSSPRSLPITRNSTEDFGEYAIMQRTMQQLQPFRKTSMPLFNAAAVANSMKYRQKTTSTPQVQIVKPGANMTNHPQSSFKPITANLPKVIDQQQKASISPKTVDNLLTRQLSSIQNNTMDHHGPSSGSPPVIKNDSVLQQQRPNSVNSDTCGIITNVSIAATPVTRPSSVSSESSLSRSRPSSSSSDLNSSSSTLVGSRPPSVSSERELHYITLEHECCGAGETGTTTAAGGTKSPRCCLKQCSHEQSTCCSNNTTTSCSVGGGGCTSGGGIIVTATTPPNVVTTPPVFDPKYQYTSIDFVATDGLKQNTTTFLPIKH